MGGLIGPPTSCGSSTSFHWIWRPHPMPLAESGSCCRGRAADHRPSPPAIRSSLPAIHMASRSTAGSDPRITTGRLVRVYEGRRELCHEQRLTGRRRLRRQTPRCLPRPALPALPRLLSSFLISSALRPDTGRIHHVSDSRGPASGEGAPQAPHSQTRASILHPEPCV